MTGNGFDDIRQKYSVRDMLEFAEIVYYHREDVEPEDVGPWLIKECYLAVALRDLAVSLRDLSGKLGGPKEPGLPGFCPPHAFTCGPRNGIFCTKCGEIHHV